MEEKMKRGQRLEDMKNLIYSGKKLHADELAVRYRISRRLIFKKNGSRRITKIGGWIIAIQPFGIMR